jgi:hypothetical protein
VFLLPAKTNKIYACWIVGRCAAAHVTQARDIRPTLIAKSPKTGLSQGECYTQAGFKTGGRSADASRLLTEANVRDRISEILAPAVRKTRVSVETLLAELETTITDARQDGQHSVVIAALALSAKLVGLLRDKIEGRGGKGTYAGLEDDDAIAERMLDDFGSVAEMLSIMDALRAPRCSLLPPIGRNPSTDRPHRMSKPVPRRC